MGDCIMAFWNAPIPCDNHAEMAVKTSIEIELLGDELEEKMKDMGLNVGFDVGLEMSGSEFALRDMVDNMMMGGKVALLGIPSKEIKIDLNKIIFKALNLKAIYGREIYETWYKGLALIDSGLKIEEIITHRFKFEDYKKAFDLLNKGKAGKVILSWD